MSPLHRQLRPQMATTATPARLPKTPDNPFSTTLSERPPPGFEIENATRQRFEPAPVELRPDGTKRGIAGETVPLRGPNRRRSQFFGALRREPTHRSLPAGRHVPPIPLESAA